MSGNTVYGTWSQAQALMVNHFQHSTVEFIWDGSSTVASSMVSLCFVMNCLVMHFKSEKYKQFENPTAALGSKFKEFNLQVLRINTRILKLQKFSPAELLLVYNYAKDSTNGVHLLQTPLQSVLPSVSQLKIPTVILSEVKNKNMSQNGLASSLVVDAFTTALLIFVNPFENIVGVGCFSFQNEIENHWVEYTYNISYVISIKPLASGALTSFMHLNEAMESMQSNLHLKSTIPWQTSQRKWFSCSLNQFNQFIKSVNDLCEVYKVFFQFSNCTNFRDCVRIYHDLFGFKQTEDRTFLRTWKIIAHGQEELSFYLQFFFPDENFFDVNLTAFLYPFELQIWVCIIVTTVVIYVLLTKLHSEKGWVILLRQCSILLEQGQSQLYIKKISVKRVFYMWIFLSIFLRQFYTSSLHSFMTAKIEPDNYPKNMEQLLNRSDFGLIATQSFRRRFKYRFDDWAVMKGLHFPKPIENFYIKMLFKAICAPFDGWFMENLVDLANGKSVIMEKLENSPNKNGVEVVRRLKLTNKRVSFTKFAAVRESSGGKAIDKETLFFWNNSILQRVPKQMHFHREVWMWSFRRPSFAAIPFIRFIGSFVHSGIYKMVLIRAENNGTFKLWRGMKRSRDLDISSGNLYSHIFMASSSRIDQDEPVATTLKAFTGTFVIGAFKIGAAILSLIIELIGRIKISIQISYQ